MILKKLNMKNSEKCKIKVLFSNVLSVSWIELSVYWKGNNLDKTNALGIEIQALIMKY